MCCLAQGPEEAYVLGEEIARTIYKPVMKSHRCSVEQMAILEPVLSETMLGTCLTILREATDEAVRLVPPIQVTLESAIEFIADDELVEITPKSIRIRKRFLQEHERKRASRVAA